MARRAVFRILPAAVVFISTAAIAEPVAVTFDDLPVFGRPATTSEAAATTRKLLAGLVRNHVQSIGFVNEIKLEGSDKPKRIALLRQWLAAGMDLGNHSYSHLSLTTTPVGTYIDDVGRGEAVTRILLGEQGRTPRWFRHPYLETGPTLAIRRQFETWLATHGYQVAPVSMENADWVFTLPYDDALSRHDRRGAAVIRDAYLRYTAMIVPWYRQAALSLLGRRPAFVLLLHASRLNADCIGPILHILRAQHLQIVSLETAMADPAYAFADDYAGPDGDTWLTRWSRTLHRELPWAALPRPPDAILLESTRLDLLDRLPSAPRR